MKERAVKREYIKAGEYLIQIMGSVLNGTPAPEIPKGVSWGLLYDLARRGAVSGLCFYAVETLKERPENEIYARWKKDRDRTVYRKLCFDAEREEILKELAGRGISCLPLKGILLSEYYPNPGMREMVDNDILYGLVEENVSGTGFCIHGRSEEEKEQSVKKAGEIAAQVMAERGYELDEEESYHDAYVKKPMYNFELHRQMVSEKVVSSQYYKEPWRLAVRDTENPFLFHMKDEDEYIFLISHEYNNHYVRGDSKLRFLVDLYVFLRRKQESMDWEYIERELGVQKLTQFDQKVRELSGALFAGARLTDRQEKLFFFLLDTGADSESAVIEKEVTAKMLLRESVSEGSKLAYIWNRICLPEESLETYYPFFNRHRYLMPFLMAYRFFKGVSVKRGRLIQEIRSLWKV